MQNSSVQIMLTRILVGRSCFLVLSLREYQYGSTLVVSCRIQVTKESSINQLYFTNPFLFTPSERCIWDKRFRATNFSMKYNYQGQIFKMLISNTTIEAKYKYRTKYYQRHCCTQAGVPSC